jgi:hypothetical protein
MLSGRFLSALLPPASLWLQRNLLNLLGAWVTERLRGAVAHPVPARVASAPVHALVVLLLLLLAVDAGGFALGAAARAAEGHLREWVGHEVARRHHETTTGADLEHLELPGFWDRAQRTWNGAVIIESMDGTLNFASSLVTLAATMGVLLRIRWQIAPIVLAGAVPALWIGVRHARQNLDFGRRTMGRVRLAVSRPWGSRVGRSPRPTRARAACRASSSSSCSNTRGSPRW